MMPGPLSDSIVPASRRPRTARQATQRRGSAMLVVVVIAAMISVMVMAMLYRLTAEQSASLINMRSQQAWSAAMAGIQHAAALVASDRYDPSVWQDDDARLHHQFVFSDGVDDWYFSVFMPTDDPGEPYRHGVGDEAARLHLAHVSPEQLTDLAGLTPDRAEAIYTYLQTGQATAGGDAESTRIDTALELTISSGAITPGTIDELLLVRPIHAALLYGQASHAARRTLRSADDDLLDADPDARLGLRHWLTVWSDSRLLSSDGTPLVSIDAAVSELEQAGMPESAVDYIRARRDANSPVTHPAELLDASIQVQENNQTVTIDSGITPAEIGNMLDRFAPAPNHRTQGLVNVNTASAAVLRRISGIDEDLADQIVMSRGNLDAQSRRTPGWLVEMQLIESESFRTLAPHLTARCDQFRLLAAGYSPTSGAYRVVEAVVDLPPQGPRIVYLREVTQLGLPFALERDTHLSDQ